MDVRPRFRFVINFETRVKVKSYSDLPLVERDPATALLIEDGRAGCIRLDDYDGLRSMAEVLAYAVPASEIRELHVVARQLGLGNVRMLRVTAAAGFTGILSPNDYDCLEEIGVALFAMCEDEDFATAHGDAADRTLELADQFVGFATFHETSGSARWQQLAYYTAAVRKCGLGYKLPPWLKSQEAMLIADDRTWWGFPQAASTRQAKAFADYVAGHCGRWEHVRGVLDTTWRWIDAHGREYSGFEQMFEAFKASRSLEPWVKAAA